MNLSALDEALCDAIMAAQHGSYDAQTVEKHLRSLLERIRTEGVVTTYHLPTESTGECSICLVPWPCPEAGKPVLS